MQLEALTGHTAERTVVIQPFQEAATCWGHPLSVITFLSLPDTTFAVCFLLCVFQVHLLGKRLCCALPRTECKKDLEPSRKR